VIIRSYYFDGYGGAADGILNAAVGSVGLFDAKFAPYPYESLSIVQADIHDGQEYDGLVFLATEFYGQYGGSTRSNLVTIGVHEIAHQWWFGLVGSDQALEPWLDEALAVYSERIYYEFNRSGSYLDWWWNFRVDFFGPSGFVDTTIYEGGAFRPYTNAVYLNGAHFLEALRGRQGDDAFYRFLKDYAGEFSRRRASGRAFFALARRYTDRPLDDLIAQYFKGAY
jgi:aminopeptidase N